MIEKIESNNAPAAIGPYSQAVKTDSLIFVSGCLPIDPKTNEMPADIAAQTRQSLENIRAILAQSGNQMSDVVKTTVLLQDMNDFNAMNEVYATYFDGIYPARVCYEVCKLPKGAKVEIDAIAVVK